MYFCWFLLFLNVLMANGTKPVQVQILEKLKAGIRSAKGFLTLNHAASVAKLVGQALEKTSTKSDKTKVPNNIFSGFMRLLGFDSKKVGAIAVNAIIVVAQLISSAISITPPSQLVEFRSLKKESPLDWIRDNDRLSELLAYAKNGNLSDMVLEYVRERSLDEDTGCVQLLICKSSVLVGKMQEVVGDGGKEKGSPEGGVLYGYFPGVDEFGNCGDECERRYPYCTTDL